MSTTAIDPMEAGATNTLDISNIFKSEAEDLKTTPIKEYERAKVGAEQPETKLPNDPATPGTGGTEPPPLMPKGPGELPKPTDADKLRRAAIRNAKTNDFIGSTVVALVKKIDREQAKIADKELPDLIDAWEDYLKENPDAVMPAWAQLAIINLSVYGVKLIDVNQIMGLFGGGKKQTTQPPVQTVTTPAAQTANHQPPKSPIAPPAFAQAQATKAAAPAAAEKPKPNKTLRVERGPAPQCALPGCQNEVKWVNGRWQKYCTMQHSNQHKADTGLNKPKEKQHTNPPAEK